MKHLFTGKGRESVRGGGALPTAQAIRTERKQNLPVNKRRWGCGGDAVIGHARPEIVGPATRFPPWGTVIADGGVCRCFGPFFPWPKKN